MPFASYRRRHCSASRASSSRPADREDLGERETGVDEVGHRVFSAFTRAPRRAFLASPRSPRRSMIRAWRTSPSGSTATVRRVCDCQPLLGLVEPPLGLERRCHELSLGRFVDAVTHLVEHCVGGRAPRARPLRDRRPASRRAPRRRWCGPLRWRRPKSSMIVRACVIVSRARVEVRRRGPRRPPIRTGSSPAEPAGVAGRFSRISRQRASAAPRLRPPERVRQRRIWDEEAEPFVPALVGVLASALMEVGSFLEVVVPRRELRRGARVRPPHPGDRSASSKCATRRSTSRRICGCACAPCVWMRTDASADLDSGREGEAGRPSVRPAATVSSSSDSASIRRPPPAALPRVRPRARAAPGRLSSSSAAARSRRLVGTLDVASSSARRPAAPRRDGAPLSAIRAGPAELLV